MIKRIFIVAGEESGDLHASNLMRAIKEINPSVEFRGIGGSRMIDEGLDAIYSLKDVAYSGFWEVAKHYFQLKKILDNTKNMLTQWKPDLFLAVDYPGFNLRLSVTAKSICIPVYYYIAPQVWAWGKDRGKELHKKIDKLMVIFPFEEDYFRKLGVNTQFVGHPLLDNPLFSAEFMDLNSRKRQIAILPGSRAQELKSHLPLISDVIQLMNKELPDYTIKIALPQRLKKDFRQELSDLCQISDNSLELMLESRAGIVKTGTSNLEAALCGMPFVMFYKTSKFTFLLGKRLVNLNFLSLVNILRNKPIVSELIQQDANPRRIVDSIKEILNEHGKYSSIQNEFGLLKTQLGEKGAARNAAKCIMG